MVPIAVLAAALASAPISSNPPPSDAPWRVEHSVQTVAFHPRLNVTPSQAAVAGGASLFGLGYAPSLLIGSFATLAGLLSGLAQGPLAFMPLLIPVAGPAITRELLIHNGTLSRNGPTSGDWLLWGDAILQTIGVGLALCGGWGGAQVRPLLAGSTVGASLRVTAF